MMFWSKLALVFASLLTAAVAQQSSETSPVRIDPVLVGARSAPGSCLSDDILQPARRNTSAAVQQVLSEKLAATCGGPGWRLAVSLDMADPSQQCPSPWIETTTPVRSCFKGSGHGGGCLGVRFPVSGSTYNRVCGYVTASGLRTNDGFHAGSLGTSIDGAYMDGVSVTRGTPREHIWTYAFSIGRCPCAGGFNPPSYVGDNYFCNGQPNRALYSTECSGCCSFNTPPAFNAAFQTSSSDDIEVRICTNQAHVDETVHISSLELFVF